VAEGVAEGVRSVLSAAERTIAREGETKEGGRAGGRAMTDGKMRKEEEEEEEEEGVFKANAVSEEDPEREEDEDDGDRGQVDFEWALVDRLAAAGSSVDVGGHSLFVC